MTVDLPGASEAQIETLLSVITHRMNRMENTNLALFSVLVIMVLFILIFTLVVFTHVILELRSNDPPSSFVDKDTYKLCKRDPLSESEDEDETLFSGEARNLRRGKRSGR